jgi:hypothetical protein
VVVAREMNVRVVGYRRGCVVVVVVVLTVVGMVP